MAGTHSLQTNMTFDGLSNITMEGSYNSSIVVTTSNVVFLSVKNVSILALVFELAESGSRVSFLNSQDISLSEVVFRSDFGSPARPSAVVSIHSDFTCMNSHFMRCIGGAITVINSTAQFSGTNVFSHNAALNAGGALYAESSNISFDGKTVFLENTAGMEGGAILACGGSILSFNGSTIFYGNSVTDSFAANNSPVKGGGAIALLDSQLQLDDFASFVSNVAPNGGALYAHSSRITSRGNSAFDGNIANRTNDRVDADHHTETADSGLGGSIWCKGTELQLCSATFNNSRADYGGSVYMITSVVTLSGHVLVHSSTAAMYGGGILLESSHLHLPSSGVLHISRNCAHIKGSAMYLYNATMDASGRFSVRDCFPQADGLIDLDGTLFLKSSILNFYGRTLFENNSAYDGGAIYATISRVRMKNYTVLSGNKAELNGGGFYLEKSKLALLDTVILVGNSAKVQGGCVYSSIGSVSFLSGWATYERNTARDGGVFALENRASLILSEPLHLNLTANHAYLNGGVIFYTDIFSTTDCVTHAHSELRPLPLCFLELNVTLPFNISTLDIVLNLTQNTAGLAGSVLYGGNLGRCRLMVSDALDLEFHNECEAIDGYYEVNPLSIVNILFTLPTMDETKTATIGSAPLQICFCQNGVPDCELRKTVRIARGETFTLSAVTVGQAQGTVPSVIKADSDSNVEISSLQRTQQTYKTCTDISYQIFTERDAISLILYPDGPCRDTGIARTTVQVVLIPCPNGFTRSRSQTECVCEDRLLLLNATCNIDKRSFEVMGGVWLQPVYRNGTYIGVSLHSNCPAEYCVSSHTNVTFDNPEVLCDHNRTGILCGSCMANYSLALGSFHCLKCSNDYLSLLIPFALAGVLLVIFLLALDLTVAKGTINGLILYANIVQANKAVFLPAQWRNFLTVFIAWLNLDFGIESCFFDGLTAYTHTWLQFAFPLYVWFLISLIIVISHKSRHVTKWLSTNPVAVLATLLLMSYAKILQTIICTLSRTHLDTPTGFKAVWSYNGNIDYFESTHHIVLGFVAVAALVLLFLPYSLLLLFGWELQYYSGKKLFSWISKLKPFMDTIYGPFRTGMRYWPGLLLVIRCALLLTFAFNSLSPKASSTSSTSLLAITSVFAGLAVLAWISGRIYNEHYVDVIEAMHILNLTIFAAATYHVKVTKGNQAMLAYTSISISFVLFVGVVLLHVYLRIRHKAFWKRLHLELTIARNYESFKKLTSKRVKVKEEDIGSVVDLTTAPGDSTEPTTSYITLREPLLESD